MTGVREQTTRRLITEEDLRFLQLVGGRRRLTQNTTLIVDVRVQTDTQSDALKLQENMNSYNSTSQLTTTLQQSSNLAGLVVTESSVDLTG